VSCPEEGTIVMTPQDIVTQLDQLADGPHDDAATIALAQIAAEAVRVLNHATAAGRGGLSDPVTVYAVTGQLATAAHRLPQLCGQLARWLAAENAAGRLACSAGRLDYAVDDARVSLGHAARDAARLGEALDRAHRATAWLYRPSGEGGEDR
jgi:hypothetical protein